MTINKWNCKGVFSVLVQLIEGSEEGSGYHFFFVCILLKFDFFWYIQVMFILHEFMIQSNKM